MSTTTMTLSGTFGAGARITSSGDTTALLTDDLGRPILYVITDDDTVPTLNPAKGHRIERHPHDGGYRQGGVTLSDGQRLWLATRGAAFDVTITTGPV